MNANRFHFPALFAAFAAASLGLGAVPAHAVPVVVSAAGVDALAIAGAVDAFRGALGASNGNLPGLQPGGRREINWDGGGDAAPATVFANPMTTFSSRGNVNTTPGTGLEISGQPSPEFGEINPTYPDIFATFSAPRLFAPLDSNIVDVFFTVPGTTDETAFSNAFGAVFTDVDLVGVTTMEFFDPVGASLGSFDVAPFDQGLSFLGVIFDDALIGRTRLTLGNSALGPNDGGGIDVVALDDFIYAEPVLQAVPEPATLAMFGMGLAGLALLARATKRRPLAA